VSGFHSLPSLCQIRESAVIRMRPVQSSVKARGAKSPEPGSGMGFQRSLSNSTTPLGVPASTRPLEETKISKT